MDNVININKRKIFFAIAFSVIFLFFSIWFIIEPKIFVRNFFMREWHIILLGVISTVYFLVLIFSFFKISSKSYGIFINEEYFIDNTRYESIGKIEWNEVSKIKRINKTSIQIFFKKNLTNKISANLLKKFLLMMHNWDYSNSIVISSALLECDIDYLEKIIINKFNNQEKEVKKA